MERPVEENYRMRCAAGMAVLATTLALGACGGDGDAASSAGGDGETDGSSAGVSRLDCGKGRAGSERALRQFTAILRAGDEAAVRAVLAPRGRFEWISAHDARGPDVSVRGNPAKAAEAVARRGGLPMEVVRFSNSEPPRRTTDLGFSGLWEGNRQFTGKAALDCLLGKARVLSVGVPP
jgi:hypothetical protein